jgi:F0F1-type ATP synthase gamma subunit
MEYVDSPLAEIRAVKSVALCLVTGDRGLCGGYNNFAIKKVGNPRGYIPFVAMPPITATSAM